MKQIALVFSIAFLSFNLQLQRALATKLDGTSTVVVQTSQYNFDADSAPIGADGAVWFQNGFIAYNDPTPQDTEIDVVFPVNGEVDLNSGTVSLLHDVVLGTDATVINSGTIKGGNNAIQLNGDLSYSTNTLTIGTSTTIDGKNHRFTLSSGATLSVSDSQTITFKNMDLFLDGTLSMGSGATLLLDNVRLHLPGNTTFSVGAFTIRNNCSLDAPSGTIFTYSSSSAFTIEASSSLLIHNGVTFKHNSAALFTLSAVTSKLILNGATFESANSNVTLQTGALWIEHHSFVKSSGSGAVTLGHVTNDLAIEILPGARLDVSAGSVTYANAS